MAAASGQIPVKKEEENKKKDEVNSASLSKLSSFVAIAPLIIIFMRMFA